MKAQLREHLLALLDRCRQALGCADTAQPLHLIGCLCDLRRKNIACLQLFHALQCLIGRFLPLDLSVFEQQHMFAVIGDILCMVLNDNDGLTMTRIQFAQHLIDTIGMHRVQLGNRFIQNEHIRPQRHRTCQCKQVGLSAGQLPDVFLFPSLKTALCKRCPAAFQIIRIGIIEAGIRGIVQHRRANDLILKILIDISNLARQFAHVALSCIHTVNQYLTGKVPRNKVGDQSVERFTQGGLSAAVVANDREKVPLFYFEGKMTERGLCSAWVCIRQVVDLYHVHLSVPPSVRCSSS